MGSVFRARDTKLGRDVGEIEVGSGRTATGVPRLQELEKEATQKGFILIAHKASAATASRRE
jgi:hypothetical protein